MINAPHLPGKEAATKEFFRMMMEQPDDYEVIISPALMQEMHNAPEMQQQRSRDMLQSIRFVEIPA